MDIAGIALDTGNIGCLEGKLPLQTPLGVKW